MREEHDSRVQELCNKLNHQYTVAQYSWNDANSQKFNERMNAYNSCIERFIEELSELLDNLDNAEQQIDELAKSLGNQTPILPYGGFQHER